MSKTKAISNNKLASMSGWAIAEALGCHYSGDSSPIPHGGVFYDIRDWIEYGYANCVEIWDDPDSGAIMVTLGTIHREHNAKDIESAWQCIGIEENDWDTRNNLHACIEAARSYRGIESDDYTLSLRFRPNRNGNIDEVKVWASIREWIEGLSK